MRTEEKGLVDADEAAEYLSIGVSEVRGLVANGQLVRRFIGKGTRRYRIEVDSLIAYRRNLPQDPAVES